MTIKDGLRTLLLAQSSITTLAPAQTINRQSISAIFVDAVMQGFVPPYIMIERTSYTPLRFINTTTAAGTSEIEIDCYERTEPLAEALALAVATYIKDFSGTAGSATIHRVNWTGSMNFRTEEIDGSDTRRHIATLNLSIFHQ